MEYSLLSIKWDDGLAQGEMWLSVCSWERTRVPINFSQETSKQTAWRCLPAETSPVLCILTALALACTRGRLLRDRSGVFRSPHMKPQYGLHYHSLLPNLWGRFTVQLLSRVQLYTTPWTAALQASLFFTMSQSLFRLMSIESVMPSSHLILCCPLLSSCHQSFPASGSTASDLRLCATHVLPSWFCSCCSPS